MCHQKLPVFSKREKKNLCLLPHRKMCRKVSKCRKSFSTKKRKHGFPAGWIFFFQFHSEGGFRFLPEFIDIINRTCHAWKNSNFLRARKLNWFFIFIILLNFFIFLQFLSSLFSVPLLSDNGWCKHLWAEFVNINVCHQFFFFFLLLWGSIRLFGQKFFLSLRIKAGWSCWQVKCDI